MTEIQFHQENGGSSAYQTTNRVDTNSVSSNAMSDVPTGRRFRLVPLAIICAFVVVGIIIFYNLQKENDEQVADNHAHDDPLLSQQVPDTHVTVVGENGETIVTADNQVSANNPSVQPTPVATPAPTSSGTDSNTNASPRPQAAINTNQPTGTTTPTTAQTTSNTTTKGGQVQARPQTVVVQATPVPTPATTTTVTKVNTQPATTTTRTITTYTTTTTDNSQNYKPVAPYVEYCGQLVDNHWRDVRIILPKFEKDGQAAVEYHVQVGTSNGNNDIFDHVYQQTDRVAFNLERNLDNDRDYYVRYQIKMPSGDFRAWSDTYRFRCQTSNTTTTTTTTSDASYKPATPSIESCGDFTDGRWHNTRIILPKFEKDGQAAVEYHVQVGTSNGNNDIFDHVYQQTDRVVFGLDKYLDNNREYYVRFQIKMPSGDFRAWSDTYRFKCNQY